MSVDHKLWVKKGWTQNITIDSICESPSSPRRLMFLLYFFLKGCRFVFEEGWGEILQLYINLLYNFAGYEVLGNGDDTYCYQKYNFKEVV